MQRAIGVIDWGVINRRLRESSYQCGLCQGELLRRFAEVIFRRGLEAVNAMTEIDLVGVEREDLVFSEAALNLNGQQRLLDLAMVRTIWGKKQITRELHGERGRPLGFLSRLDVTVRGADDSPHVDPPVAIEALVLG